jgi:hypothetical protein
MTFWMLISVDLGKTVLQKLPLLINNIFQALNSKKLVGGIFCDITKVFDSVDHEMLLAKLKFYGVQGNFLKLIASYFNNRCQRVVIKTNHFVIASQTGNELH